MALRDIAFEPDYNKEYVNIVDAFYNPCMRNSIKYCRITGYFASTIFYICWDSINEFIENNGKMQIVCSPFLSEEDKNAIVLGYDLKLKKMISDKIVEDVKSIFSSDNLTSSYKALTYLIANNYLDIKIAVPTSSTPDEIKKLFHDKAGLFTDGVDYVGFRGGINESFNGWSQNGNMDSIDVFTSWEEEKDKVRVQHIKEYFENLWDKKVNNTIVYDFPEEAEDIIKEQSKNIDWEELKKELSIKKSKSYRWKPDKNSSKDLRDHQLEALENWEKAGRKGIFEHATGSGKTFTAICAIKDSLIKGETPLVLVPSKELLTQWRDEIKKNIKGIDNLSFLLCGDGNTAWKTDRLLYKITKGILKSNTIIIAIMATACTDDFIENVYGGNHLFIIADEVHRLGSYNRRKVFGITCGPRLGLSATPRRYGDPVGTKAIFDYFGDIVKPVFTLKDAIDSGVLTKYFYYPETTYLDAKEQEEYDEITSSINKMIAINGGDASKLDGNNHYKTLLLNRARILKNAESKLNLALKVIENNYKDGQKWIVYCDNTTQLKDVMSLLSSHNYPAFEYYSSMKGDREETLKYFDACGGIMVSIKCLDEGVDIPSTTHALILASSKNPREFIQRRGRILRTHTGKNLAFLFDAVILPKKTEESSYNSLLCNEFARSIQFGTWAENKTCIAKLKNIAVDFDIDIENIADGGFDDYDE